MPPRLLPPRLLIGAVVFLTSFFLSGQGIPQGHAQNRSLHPSSPSSPAQSISEHASLVEVRAFIANETVPRSHLVTLAWLFRQQRPSGRFFQWNAFPSGEGLELHFVVDEKHLTSLFKQNHTAWWPALPTRSSSVHAEIEFICERAHREVPFPKVSALWALFDSQKVPAVFDAEKCTGMQFSTLVAAQEILLEGSWKWQTPGLKTNALRSPVEEVITKPVTQRFFRNKMPTDFNAAPEKQLIEVAQLFDVRGVTLRIQNALAQYLAVSLEAEVRWERKRDSALLILKMQQPLTLREWQEKVETAKRKLTPRTLTRFLKAEDKKRDLSSPIQLRPSQWPVDSASVSPRFSSARQLQGLIFPKALRGFEAIAQEKPEG